MRPNQLLRSGVVVMSVGDPTQTLLDDGSIAMTADCTTGAGAEATVKIKASGGDTVVFSADSDPGHTDGIDTGGAPVTIDQVTSAALAQDRGDFDAVTGTGAAQALDGQFLAVASGAAPACALSAFGAAG